MEQCSVAAMERAMKMQEVILRSLARTITWWQAAEIAGISARQMQGWKRGYDGLYDRRRGDWDRVFSIQHERIVNRDNTVSWANRC